MTRKLQSLWKIISKPLEIVIIILSLVLFVAVIVIVVAGYIFRWDWTGLGAHPQGKTLWDWLQLLIIPVVLAVGGYAFNLTISRNENEAAPRLPPPGVFQLAITPELISI